MLNQTIYTKDPLENRLLNNGVAEVREDHSQEALRTLRYELDTFVCEGEYEKGLVKILDAFLRNLGNDAPEQPGVWISGFYGSGKSHLAKMLRALWVNETFADGVHARDAVHLPVAVRDPLRELDVQGRRHGGLHAAAGTLGSAAGDNVRMALLGIVFRSAGLPEKYHQARFVLWLRREGILEPVRRHLAAQSLTLEEELPHLFVSEELHQAVLAAKPTLAADAQSLGDRLIAQFPEVADVSDDEMVQAVQEALTRHGQFPLTLMVLDEVQQYIGQDGDRAYRIQLVTQACCKRFRGRLLFVATGQSALTGMPHLLKIQGRFTVPVQLSDSDVEGVIRRIILDKKPTAVPQLRQVLQASQGEISRHLRGTALQAIRADDEVMVADYPLLPVRRRFWERVLRSLDQSGTISQLRNQLRIVHEAACATAGQPLGHVVAGDFIYDQLAPDLLNAGVLSREVHDTIARRSAGDDAARLKARLLKLIYLINKLPTDPLADSGVRATEDALADLLVTDLAAGSSGLRQQIPQVLQSLQEDDRLVMAVEAAGGTEYRLQTKESSEWHDEFRANARRLSDNTPQLLIHRQDLFRQALGEALGRVRVTQGQSRIPRSLIPLYEDALPRDAGQRLYLWVRDAQAGDAESSVKADARSRGLSDPTLLLFVPDLHRTELRQALIDYHAADQTL
nr:BREX system P-loop protein BrxC [Pseudomonadota bacterium]